MVAIWSGWVNFFPAIRVNYSPAVTLPPANSTELINFCRRYAEKGVHEGVLTFVVWDKKTSKTLYDPEGLIKGKNAAAEIEKAKEMFPVYGIKEFAGSAFFYGVKADVIDQKVKKKIAAEIHNSKFPLDSYIWVNEVVNYEGGDGLCDKESAPEPQRDGGNVPIHRNEGHNGRPALSERT